MKKYFLSLAALILTAAAFGQVENDDMYFNSKDRAQLKAQRASEESSYVMATAKKTKKTEQTAAAEEVINPTDSYSARNVNPEYAARSNSQTAAADNQDYFVNNYKYNTSTNLNNWNNNFNGWYNNAWYNNNYYNPGMYAMYGVTGMYSPYSSYYGNGGYYDPWGSPYYSPYSSGLGYYGGSGWGSGIGFGMSYGWGSPYYNSYYGNPYMGMGYYGGYGSYGGYGGYGYPGTIVVVNNHYGESGRNVVYGKRATHGAMITAPQDASYTRSRTSYTPTTRPDASGGRVASHRQDDYYNRSWRNSQQSSYSTPSRSSSYDSWGNTNRSGTDSYYRHDSGSSYSPSRSSSFDSGGGGGSRPSAPASSGSNGRTRGRD